MKKVQVVLAHAAPLPSTSPMATPKRDARRELLMLIGPSRAVRHALLS